MKVTTMPTLNIAGLEQIYDALANAIDAAGPEKTELFLVKLALLQANAEGDPQRVQAHIEVALKDL